MTISAWEHGKVRLKSMIGNIDYHLTHLQRLVNSSDLNIWLGCCLSNHRFLVSNPLYKYSLSLKDRHTGDFNKMLRSKEDMAKHFGTALFARLFLWGFNVYVALDDAYMPPQYQKTIDKNQSKAGNVGLTNDKNLPPIKDIQKMLKKSITSLPSQSFALLQSILMNMWALQPFSEPIRYEDRRANKSTPSLDNENDNSTDEDEPRKTKVRSDFKVFSQATQQKSPALRGLQTTVITTSPMDKGTTDASSTPISSSSNMQSANIYVFILKHFTVFKLSTISIG